MSRKQSHSDRSIVKALEAGGAEENRALEKIYRAGLPGVIQFITQNQGSEEEARDIFQDAVIVFYEQVKAQKFRGESQIRVYLYQISRNMWLNRLKRKGVEMKYEQEQAREPGIQAFQDSQEKEPERSTLVNTLLEKLGEQCRTILRYALYYRYPMEEIRHLMGFKNEQVARNKHYKCKKELRQLVDQDPELKAKIRELL